MIFGTLGRCGQCCAEKVPSIQNKAMESIAVLTPNSSRRLPPAARSANECDWSSSIRHKGKPAAILLPTQQIQKLSIIALRTEYGLPIPQRDQVATAHHKVLISVSARSTRIINGCHENRSIECPARPLYTKELTPSDSRAT
jgi:hypothetical protein